MKDFAALALAATALPALACGGDDEDTTDVVEEPPAEESEEGEDTEEPEEETEEEEAEEEEPTAGLSCLPADAVISNNHNHTFELTLTSDMVANPSEVVVDIAGTGTHPHDVVLSAADIITLTGGGSVVVASSLVNGHTHDVTVVCSAT